jgi:hypothetical protein
VFVSRRCCRSTGCVCWFGGTIFGVFLWLGRSACAWVLGFVNVLGAGLATFVGRDRGAGRFATGVLGCNGSGAVVDGLFVGVADGRIRVLVDGSRWATRASPGPFEPVRVPVLFYSCWSVMVFNSLLLATSLCDAAHISIPRRATWKPHRVPGDW